MFTNPRYALRMPALSKEQVRKWVDEFLLATSGKWAQDRLEDPPRPTDWKKLEDLFSKRAEVFFLFFFQGGARAAHAYAAAHARLKPPFPLLGGATPSSVPGALTVLGPCA